MHKCDYTDRVEIENGLLTRIIHADFKGKRYCNEMDVVKNDESNKWYCRNVIYNNFYHNYGVLFEGEKYYSSIMETEEYGECEVIPFYCNNNISEQDRKNVQTLYPTFNSNRFTFNDELLKGIYFWKKDNFFFDFLMEKEYKALAMSEKPYTLEESKKAQIVDFIKNNSLDTFFYRTCISYTDLMQVIRYKKLLPKRSLDNIYEYIKKFEGNDKMEERIEILEEMDIFKNITTEQKEKFLSFMRKQRIYLADSSIRRKIKLLTEFPDYPFDYVYYAETFYKSKEKVIENYERGLKYILKKYNATRKETFEKIFKIYENKENRKDLEMLLSLKLDNIALNEYFYKESENDRQKIKGFIRKNLDVCVKMNPTSYEIHKTIDIGFYEHEKMEIILNYVKNYSPYNDKKTFNYLLNHNILMSDYNHYMDMVSTLGHNEDEEYWRYPTDFKSQNEKVQKEIDKRNEALDLETQNQYVLAVQKFLKENPQKKIDGYEVFIPETVADIRRQAQVLSQCLMRCNYPQKVINGDSVLVFLRQNGTPIATCEINQNDKTIRQFYRDEKDRNHCQATSEDKEIMNKWLNTAVITEKEFSEKNKEVA